MGPGINNCVLSSQPGSCPGELAGSLASENGVRWHGILGNQKGVLASQNDVLNSQERVLASPKAFPAGQNGVMVGQNSTQARQNAVLASQNCVLAASSRPRERFGRQQQARMASWQLAGSQNSAQKLSRPVCARAPYRNLDIDVYTSVWI